MRKGPLFASAFLIALLFVIGAVVPLAASAAEAEPELESRATRKSTRVVLIETFTSVQCYYCPYNEEALQDLQTDYGYEKMVFIAYHGFYGSDPYSTSEGVSRGQSYYGVGGVPTSRFDGVVSGGVSGTGPSDYASTTYNSYKAKVDARLTVAAPIDINIAASIGSNSIDVTVSIEKLDSTDLSPYYVRAVVAEDGISHSGKTWDSTQRDLAETQIGTDFTGTKAFQLTLDYVPSWNKDNLKVVAFVQRGAYNSPSGSKEVLNCNVTDTFIPNKAPTTSLVYPTGGEDVEGNMNITWTASDPENTPEQLDVTLFYKTDSQGWTVILQDEPNVGFYVWDTTTVDDGTAYQIRLNVTDIMGAGAEAESPVFEINNPDPPELTVTSPTSGSTYNDNITINWTATDGEDDAGDLTIDIYYTLDGTTWTALVEDGANSGTFLWDITSVQDSTYYRIKVIVEDTSGLSTEYLMIDPFTIDWLENPIISIDTPLGGMEIADTFTIYYSATDGEDAKSALKVTIEISSDDGTTWTKLVDKESYSGSYNMDTTLLDDGDYLMRMTVYDTDDLKGHAAIETPFTVYNNDAPQALLTTPSADTTADASLVLEFTTSDQEDLAADLDVFIEYSEDQLNWEIIEELDGEATNYTWDTLDLATGDYYLRIRAKDTRDLETTTTPIMVTVAHNYPPTISIRGPTGGTTSGDIRVTWSATDPEGETLLITIEYQQCIGGMCYNWEELATGEANDGEYLITAGTLEPAEYHFKVTATEETSGQSAHAETTAALIVVEATTDGGDGGSGTGGDGGSGTGGGGDGGSGTGDGGDGGSGNGTTAGGSSGSNSASVPLAAVGGIAIAAVLFLILIIVLIVVVIVRVAGGKKTPPPQPPQEQPPQEDTTVTEGQVGPQSDSMDPYAQPAQQQSAEDLYGAPPQQPMQQPPPPQQPIQQPMAEEQQVEGQQPPPQLPPAQ